MTSDAAHKRLVKTDYERLSAFRYELSRFLSFSGAEAEKAGLTPQQHQALLAIKGYPGKDEVTVGELAARLGLKHHSTVGLVDRLAAHGLVRRHAGTTDRRAVLVALTDEAEALLERVSGASLMELRASSEVLRAFAGVAAEAEAAPSGRS